MGESAAPLRADRSCILVVDDEPAVRFSIEAVLADDFDVITAADALEARRIMKKTRVDVVVTDHHMPHCLGTELIRRIQVQTPEVVCILLTGHADMPEVRNARSERLAFHILIKPVNPEQLLSWVRTASQSARLRAAVDGLKRQVVAGRS